MSYNFDVKFSAKYVIVFVYLTCVTKENYFLTEKNLNYFDVRIKSVFIEHFFCPTFNLVVNPTTIRVLLVFNLNKGFFFKIVTIETKQPMLCVHNVGINVYRSFWRLVNIVYKQNYFIITELKNRPSRSRDVAFTKSGFLM